MKNVQRILLSVIALGLCVMPQWSAAFAQGEEEMSAREQLELMRDEVERRFEGGVAEFLEQELPEALGRAQEQLERFESGRLSIPEQFEALESLMMLAQIGNELRETKGGNPERYGVFKEFVRHELHAQELARAYRTAESEKEGENIEQELRGTLERGFDLGQRMRELDAEQIERELEQIQKMLKDRIENRELIIERHMRELLSDFDPLEW